MAKQTSLTETQTYPLPKQETTMERVLENIAKKQGEKYSFLFQA